MDVFFSDIPEEGLHLEGKFPESIFDLDPNDSIRTAGPVHYEVDLYAFEEVVTLHGTLRGPFQLLCGACLEYFDYEANFTDWSAEVEREPGVASFDFKELIREEFLLNLPPHLRCDEYLEDRVCPRADLVDEFIRPVEEEEVEEEGNPDAWGALDQWQAP